MNAFTLGAWVAISLSAGGIKRKTEEHTLCRACFFNSEKDRDAFLSLSKEQFPHETFCIGTYDNVPAVINKFVR